MTILQRLKERRSELKSDFPKDKKLFKEGEIDKQYYESLKLVTQHRIDELDYIIILLKEEGIIPETKKYKIRKIEYQKRNES